MSKPAELPNGFLDGARHARAVRHIAEEVFARAYIVISRNVADVRTHDHGTLPCQLACDRAPDPARRARHERDATVERPTCAALPELRLLELPVLDGEQVGLAERAPAA